MKPLYFLLILIIPGLALAQASVEMRLGSTVLSSIVSPSGQLHEHVSPERELAWLTKKLGLSEGQQGKIKPLLIERNEQLKTIEENSTFTKAQMYEQVKELNKRTNQKIESYLIPAQIKVFEKLHHNQWAQVDSEN